MVRGRILQSAKALNLSLNKTLLGRSRIVRILKRRGRSVLLRLLARDSLILTRVGEVPLYVYADTADFDAYHSKPYEPFTAQLFTESVRRGARVVDVGAQFGYFSVLAARKTGAEGRVLAFEPVPTNLTVLRRNIDLHECGGIVTIVPKAVGEESGTASILLSEGSHSHGLYPHPDIRTKGELKVECVALDDEIGSEKVDVIKMDIEGHEPYALKGMKKTLSRNRDLVLLLELAPVLLRSGGTPPDAFVRQIRELGFSIQAINDESRSLGPLSSDMLRRSDPSWKVNLFCTRS
ncbi:MAG: FkbM family methyltransferase [Nitrospirae bacterium]|nr:FkbM family methyltransferase [Nitrospirota bacterium]